MPAISKEALRKRRHEFQEEAGRAFDRMLGSDGQNGLVTFAEREDRACDLGDGLTLRLLAEHLAADEAADEAADPGAAAAAAAAAVPCPICGRPVPPGAGAKAKPERRRVLTRRGEVDYERAARRCKHCRRIFFPRR